MAASAKWIDGIDAEGSVTDAARRSVEPRLTAVIRALPLAAHLAEHDIEHVHRLRVSTRRAVAALELYHGWLPKKTARWFRKRLKKIRRAAGAARDLDVLATRLRRDYGDRSAPVVDIIAPQRSEAQPAIIDVAERCRRNDRFVRKLSKLLKGIAMPDKAEALAPSFRGWAAEQLATSSNAFFSGIPRDPADTAALHEFRIRGKQLRYTIELVASAFDRSLRSKLYPIVEELQERLGKVQDHAAAIAHLCDWADDAGNREHKNLLREIAEEEREHLIDTVNDFRRWWTDDRIASLRSGLNQLVGEDSTESHRQAAHQT